VGTSGPDDDATFNLRLDLENPDLPLPAAVEAAFNIGKTLDRSQGLGTPTPDCFLGAAKDCLQLVAKALLYINLPEARRSLHPEYTEALRAGANLKSAAKKAKAAKRVARLFDYVLIDAPPSETGRAGGSAEHASPKAHWRRGHYRLQAHGVNFALRKLIFLKPMLIAAQGERVGTHVYEVR
jgi:hypothetical protein